MLRRDAAHCGRCGGKPVEVHGDGRQSRDFNIDYVVEANLFAAASPNVGGKALNVGCAERMSLLEIIALLEEILGRRLERRHTPSLTGDVPHTLADVAKAKLFLGYTPPWGSTKADRRRVLPLDRTTVVSWSGRGITGGGDD